MNELLNRLIANDFADLEGLQLTGNLPVKQELLNEVLAELLRQGQAGKLAAPAPAAGRDVPAAAAAASAPKIDPASLLKFVRRAEVTADDGRLTLHFHVEVGGGRAGDAG